MDSEEIIENSRKTVDKARFVNELLKSPGWKIYLEVKDRKRQEMVDKMFNSEMTVKKHEYNRGAVNFIKDIEKELQGLVDDADEAGRVIKEIADKEKEI